MKFFNIKKSKIVKLSNGNYVPLARNVGFLAIPGPWYGLANTDWGDPERVFDKERIVRFCQCADEATAEAVIKRRYPDTDPLVLELSKAL